MHISIRARVTTLAVLVVAVVLTIAAVSLVAMQRRALTTQIDQALMQRADDLATLVGGGAAAVELPDRLDEGFAQVIGPDGVIRAASSNVREAGPIIGPPAGTEQFRASNDLPVDDDLFRILSRRLPDGTVLHVGTTLDIVAEGTGALTTGLGIAIPAIVAAMGVLVWWLVGRTLRPVNAISTQVAEISTTDLDRRVPVPASGDEVAHLAMTMNSMLERLDTQVQRQRTFVADASHELRTPLTRLRTALEIELRDAAPEIHGTLGRYLEDTVDMQRIVEDMLYLARADEGQVTGADIALDFDDIVLGEVRRAQASTNLTLDTSRVSGAAVMGDRDQLTRMVRNLLDNAVDFADAAVEISLREEAGEVVLRITDDGPGIDPGDRERIFERFTKLDDARRAGGSGLGLTIVRDIVLRHGGRVAVVDDRTPGATFEVRLPALD